MCVGASLRGRPFVLDSDLFENTRWDGIAGALLNLGTWEILIYLDRARIRVRDDRAD